MAGKSVEVLREAANLKALSKRSKIALCVHGINKKYCTPCSTKKAPKSKKAAAAEAAEAKPAEETPKSEE
jgi:hypothetical protein